MRTMLYRTALVFTLAVTAAACAEDPTAPGGATADETAFSYEGPLTTGDYWIGEAAGNRDGDRRGGHAIVIHLLRRALYEYAQTNGDSAALALGQPVRDLLIQARDAFLAGDSAAAAALVRQAYTAAATIVIDLEGAAPLDRLTAVVDSGLARLDDAIARGEAAGRDVSRLIALRDFVSAEHAEAAALRAAGDLPGALVAESIAMQSLARAMHRSRNPDHDGRGGRGARGEHHGPGGRRGPR